MQTNHELLSDARSFLRDQIVGDGNVGESAESWDEFFAIYDAIIRRFARSCGLSGEELDDCIQDVWLAIVVHLEGFEIDASRGRFRTWLFQIVRSKATDLLRHQHRQRSMHASSLSSASIPSVTVLADEELSRLWRREALRTLVLDFRKRLSEENFGLFKARTLDGEPYETIGPRLGISPAAARVRHHRLLDRFRELCSRYALDELL